MFLYAVAIAIGGAGAWAVPEARMSDYPVFAGH